MFHYLPVFRLQVVEDHSPWPTSRPSASPAGGNKWFRGVEEASNLNLTESVIGAETGRMLGYDRDDKERQ